jgi:hypothetical protein
MTARREAKAYAEMFCMRYYEFQIGWPQIITTLEADPIIVSILTGVPLQATAAHSEVEAAELDEALGLDI